MADTKITGLTVGVPVLTDVVPYVSSPGASPVTKKALVSTLLDSFVWTTYASTVVGFSATTVSRVRYIFMGRILNISGTITGTSNATTFTFTVPVAPVYLFTGSTGQISNNSTNPTTPGLIYITAGSTTVNLFKDFSGAAWTASGSKGADFSFFYEW